MPSRTLNGHVGRVGGRILPWLVVLCPLTPPSLTAQPADTTLRRALMVDMRLKLALADSAPIEEAWFERLEERSVVVRAIIRPSVHESHFETRAVALDRIRRVWHQAGTHWRTGAWIGGGTGVLFMSAIAVAFSGYGNWNCDEVCTVGGIASTGVIGAVLGGLAGSLFMNWELAWPGAPS